MASKNKAGCNCCGTVTNCVIGEDTFDRANSTTVDGWTELFGDWEIETNKLQLNDGD